MKDIAIDISGQVFGRLTVIERSGTVKKQATWVCMCSCDNKKIVCTGHNLRNGHTKSCGCLGKEGIIKRSSKHGASKRGNREKLYVIWCGMKRRCKIAKSYTRKNIKICEDWQDYVKFKKWALDSGYLETLTIERKDVNGNYCPENCCWIPLEEQAYNKENTYFIDTMTDGRICVGKFCKKYKIPYGTLYWRLKNNKDYSDLIGKYLAI